MQRIQLYWLECSDSELPADGTWLSIAEIACFRRGWVPKRHREWLLGRWTAKNALTRHFGLASDSETLRTISIVPAESGAPIVFANGQPMSASLSISHRDGRALAVVSPLGIAVGCDLERAEPHSSTFLQQFFTPAEIEQVERSERLDSPCIETVIWSAKETVLKMLALGLRVDTRSVSISVEVAQTHAKDWKRFSALLVDGRRFTGWWHRDSTWLKTVAASSANAIPVALPFSQCGTVENGRPNLHECSP